MNRSTSTRHNSVRIIAGNLRSRKIIFQDLPGLRPTADRIRETLFNWLRNDVAGEACLDLFAGSGALGIEALSRGAEKVTFVEKDAATSAMINQNLEQLAIVNAEISCMDAEQWIQQHSMRASNGARDSQFGIVFLDPPFSDKSLYRVCSQLDRSNLLKSNCKIYLESACNITESDLPCRWLPTKSKKAGQVHYYLLERRKGASDLK
jgi:16S rRNA (guanine966-N2)-methyltransferase